jgi:hypothetical protein
VLLLLLLLLLLLTIRSAAAAVAASGAWNPSAVSFQDLCVLQQPVTAKASLMQLLLLLP